VRLYTLDEARATLPDIIPILEGLRQAFLELRAIEAARAAAARAATADGHALAAPFAEDDTDPAEALRATIRRSAEALERRGIELKDPARGLIDFLHRHEGRIVYLCYHLGEPTIAYWHELDAGFAGRKPI
jgi:hypothetical protein